ncbi:hypothetical protein QBC47DRAFT_357367 [Echria macrotheca]|uniref:Nitrogen regulatory protein areA GATA-like domain-containing protein n=1 Tax=Echria macrotheca TaxID=438768 RepID=A0AAJ0BKB3_9PEZI|nr:hypothetical protein QBC47DRAFT_357367 [Echria macrotheca]
MFIHLCPRPSATTLHFECPPVWLSVFDSSTIFHDPSGVLGTALTAVATQRRDPPRASLQPPAATEQTRVQRDKSRRPGPNLAIADFETAALGRNALGRIEPALGAELILNRRIASSKPDGKTKVFEADPTFAIVSRRSRKFALDTTRPLLEPSSSLPSVMPCSLDAPVLQVDANVIHKVDTTNPENLFSMWTAQGRRLENLSWRLWNRETFCCESGEGLIESTATSQPQRIRQSRGSSAEDLPQLSGSVDSVADEEAVDFTAESAPVDIIRPRIRRQDSCASSRSRGRERHITSDDLEKMVVSIIEAKTPLLAPLPNISLSPPVREKAAPAPAPEAEAERSGSTTTESPCNSSETPSMESTQSATAAAEAAPHKETIITLGFSPARSTCRITSHPAQVSAPNAIPEPNDTPAPKLVQPNKKQAKFQVGGSSGSGEESYSDRTLETRRQPAPQPKKAIFQIGRESSEAESSLKSALHPARQGSLLNAQKKTASFSNQVVTQTYQTSAISDGEQSDTDYVDESAIDDDDDSSDWEDSVEESGKSSVDEKFNFQRVDSKVNLTSRRSLLTLMVEQNKRTQSTQKIGNIGNMASQSTSAIPRARATLSGPSLVASPNDSDEAPLMMKRGSRAPPMGPINEIPRSSAQPINAVATMHHQAALSPRTTRRNMLSTELTESLRRNLLWERSQKTSTANAVLKRRHTSQDIANLKQYPERPYMGRDNKDTKPKDVNPSSWDQYFDTDTFTGYHAEGW